jgi:Helicase HerA, central domain
VSQKRTSTSKLTLGWKVNKDLEPEYWLLPHAKPGGQDESHLITSPTEDMAHHTIIVAQSGSGKSFFVGRLIEEILLQSKSRVLVFDPNADFRKSGSTVEARNWQGRRYNRTAKIGHLPHESGQRHFKREWVRVSKRIYSADASDAKTMEPLEIDWLNFSVDWFADDADLAFQSQLQHCHNFVNELRPLVGSMPAPWRLENELLDVGKQICNDSPKFESARVFEVLRKKFGNKSQSLQRHMRLASRYRTLFGGEAELFYFGMGREAFDSGIFATVYPVVRHPEPSQLHVIDLLSVENPLFRMMAVGNFLDIEWSRARLLWKTALSRRAAADTRKPLFIVVDEAHNIVPTLTTNLAQRRLKEWFRMIAAEGRKFGVFLILISQRPDKIDPLVVSECENKAIMKLGSEIVLDEATRLLGLSKSQEQDARKCLSFLRGRVMLCGPWAADSHTFLYSAMRRTEEGGRNLRERYWARPRRYR